MLGWCTKYDQLGFAMIYTTHADQTIIIIIIIINGNTAPPTLGVQRYPGSKANVSFPFLVVILTDRT